MNELEELKRENQVLRQVSLMYSRNTATFSCRLRRKINFLGYIPENDLNKEDFKYMNSNIRIVNYLIINKVK